MPPHSRHVAVEEHERAHEGARHRYRMYVSHFADYQKTYGAIGGVVVVALRWFYLTSLAILIGAQLDASIGRASIETQPPRRENP